MSTTIAGIFGVLQKNIPEAMQYIYGEGYSTGVADTFSYLSEKLGVSPVVYSTGTSLLLDALNTTEGEFIYMASDTEALRNIENKLDRIETRIDKISTDTTDIKVQLAHVDERLKSLEKKKETTFSVIKTIILFIAMVASVIGAIVALTNK